MNATEVRNLEAVRRILNVAVFAVNANGEADIFFTRISCTQGQYNLGDHYNLARELAEEAGYEVESNTLVADENEPACRAVTPEGGWDSLLIHEVKDK